MALKPFVADVPLLLLNQKPGRRAGPTGRLTSLLDAQIRQFDDQGKTVVEQREGFQSLTNELRSSRNGTVDSTFWTGPRLLEALGDQLVSVCSARPRVFNSSTWTDYDSKRVVTNRLDESVFRTTNHTIQAPDSAWLGNEVTCSVWTETSYTDTGEPVGATYAGFRGDDGAWVREPALLYAPGNSSIRTLAKVVTDGTYFWVFFNDQGGGYHINVIVYSFHGEELANLSMTQNWLDTPGYWDVHGSSSTGVLLVQPAANGPGDVHVATTLLTYSSGVITATSTTDTTISCEGPVAFLTNDVSTTREYIATVGAGDALFGYEIDPSTRLKTHAYNPGVTPNSVDSLTGWAFAGSGGNDIKISYTEYAPSQSSGPKYDPACRQTRVAVCSHDGGTTGIVRTAPGVCQVSRAFKHEDQYNAVTYWQSGSGLAQVQSSQSVTLTPGDYFIGAPSQPINVANGDFQYGSSIGVASNSIPQTVFVLPTGGSLTSSGVASGDTVQFVTASGLGPTTGVPDGTPLCLWTIASHTFTGIDGGILHVSGTTGVSFANGDFLIAGTTGLTSHQVYTYPHRDGSGGSQFPIGTFGTAGTVQVGNAAYYVTPSLDSLVTTTTKHLYLGGTLTVSGTGGPDDGTKTIFWTWQTGQLFGTYAAVVICAATSEVTVLTPWTGTVAPLHPNLYVFADGSPYDASIVGSNITVANDSYAGNNVQSPVTAASGSSITASGISGAIAEVFQAPPFPTVSIDLAISQVPYTFFLQSVTADYTWLGALIEIGAATHGQNNGVYKVIQVKDSHTLYCQPTNGKTDQRSEMLTGGTTVTAFFSQSQQPQFQSTWFITPLEGSQPQVGCFERGLAYADWRFEGQSPPNTYALALSSVYHVRNSTTQFMLPYRAKSFTAGQFAQTPQQQTTNVTVTVGESTVGLKQFQLSTECGLANSTSGTMLLPGPMASEFTASGFHEQGINLAPEAPFLVSEEQDTGVVGLTTGAVYFYQAVFEVTDDNGDRVYSYPSPILQVYTGSTDNTVTVGGRLILPLDSNGALTAAYYGLSNRATVGISLYRTAVINGVPSARLYKITNDLNVNGLYNGSGSGSGFTFPDVFTWNFRDQIADSLITSNEVVYAGTVGRGYLPRFPAPPHRQSCTFADRQWVVGYDGAVWMSGEKTEGDAWWFFPGFRFPFPAENRAVAVAGMDSLLLVFQEHGVSYIPLAKFPDPTGQSGQLPTPVTLPFPNGCTGFAKTVHEGVVYSSTAGDGQLWMVTRDLRNVYFNQEVKDFADGPIAALTVDGQQRVGALVGSNKVIVYDPVPNRWYTWTMQSDPVLLCNWSGRFTYQDSAFVCTQTPDIYFDSRNSVLSGITLDFTLADLSFSAVRSVKMLYELQAVGQTYGNTSVTVYVAYPDSPGESTTTRGPLDIAIGSTVLFVANPQVEEAPLYSVRCVFASTALDTPDRTVAVEFLACEVGVDSRTGLDKLPDGFRAV